MTFRKRRDALRLILTGSVCIRPGSVYDAISIRIAEDLGFEVGMFGGSVASLAVLGDPDIALITLTELAEQMRRMSRAAGLPVLVEADHGYGNALNVRRTVQELEATGVAALFLTGIKSRAELEAISAATTLPIVLGGAPEEMTALDYLSGQRVRIALQGHAPFAAATQAVYATLKALREGTSPRDLKGLASSELTGRAMREAEVKVRSGDFLGLGK